MTLKRQASSASRLRNDVTASTHGMLFVTGPDLQGTGTMALFDFQLKNSDFASI